MTKLLDPITIGDLKLKNRVFLAPLTRQRSTIPGRIPNALMVEYYRQRAGAGLLFSEATSVSAMGVGYTATPGIWSKEQVEGWKHVTRAVHEKGGTIFLQLWHVGRISHPMFLDDALPVAPSALPMKGYVSLVRPKTAYVTPRALEREEIPGIIEEFRRGAQNAMEAGFDGVEIHGANGYLIEQFLHAGINARDDDYGGSIENRARLLLEIADSAIAVWGAKRVGVHLSPRGDFNFADRDGDHVALYHHVARELANKGTAFLFVRESLGERRIGPDLKRTFGGAYIGNEKFTPETAQELLNKDEADAVAFGQLFIANPDLPARIARKASLNVPVPETFYEGGPAGYTDYPALEPA